MMVELKSNCDIIDMQKGTYKYVSGNSCSKNYLQTLEELA